MARLTCPKCGFARDIDHASLPPGRFKATCRQCSASFEVDAAALHAPGAAPTGSASSTAPASSADWDWADPSLPLASAAGKPEATPPSPAPAGGAPAPSPQASGSGLELDWGGREVRDAASAPPAAAVPAFEPEQPPPPPPPPLPPAKAAARTLKSIAWGLRYHLAWILPALVGLVIGGRCAFQSVDRPEVLGLGDSREGAPLNAANRVLVFLHGYGGSGADLKRFARDLVRFSKRDDLAVVMPDGPFAKGGGRAWWRPEAAKTEREEGRRRAAEYVAAIIREYGLQPREVYVGGFSQGAAVAYDIAASQPGLGGAILVAGCEYAAADLPEMRVLLVHGKADSVCGFSAATGLNARLTKLGRDVLFYPHPGDHTLPLDVRAAAGGFVAQGMP